MRRVAAGVVLAALLMLFVSLVTRTEESRTPDRETTTVLMVAVECPCGGVCEAHARAVADYTPEAEAGSSVLKLPTRNVVSPRGYNECALDSAAVTNSGLRTWYGINTELQAGRVLKLPHDGRLLNVSAGPGHVNNSSLRSGCVLKLDHYDRDESTRETIHDRNAASAMERSPNVGVQL